MKNKVFIDFYSVMLDSTSLIKTRVLATFKATVQILLVDCTTFIISEIQFVAVLTISALRLK